MAIQLFTDSLCDITDDLIKKLDLKVISLLVYFKGEEKAYLDNELTPIEIYEKAKNGKSLPSTAAVTPQRFIEAFEPYISKGDKIIYIGCGSGISSTYNNAVIASQNFEDGDVTTIDSQTLSSGISLLLNKARQMINAGKQPAEIKEEIEKLVPRLSVKFNVDKMNYIYHGGRCGSIAYIFASVLSFHPVIQMANNKMEVIAKPRGKFVKALDYQIDMFMKDLKHIDMDCVFITHSGGIGSEENAAYVYEKLRKYVPKKNLHITTAHCVVSSHCGPRCIGILYLLNK